MTVGEMRTRLYLLYPGDAWKKKVNNMKETQVIAIYMSKPHKGKNSPTPSKPSLYPSTLTDVTDIYWTCTRCGANLDPGEKCDCEETT